MKNMEQRVAVVRAMDLLARQINDEDVFASWLISGVADGDIDEYTPDEDIECYCEDDENFAELMDLFVRLMSRAKGSGGLYCDRVLSNG